MDNFFTLMKGALEKVFLSEGDGWELPEFPGGGGHSAKLSNVKQRQSARPRLPDSRDPVLLTTYPRSEPSKKPRTISPKKRPPPNFRKQTIQASNSETMEHLN